MAKPSWEKYALGLARAASARSEDHVKVGAVVLRPDMSVAGVGYNGAPSGINVNYSDRDGRRPFMIHAEVNALRLTTPQEVAGGLLAVTHIVCGGCLPMVAAYGVRKVVYGEELDPIRYDTSALTDIAWRLGITMYRPCPAEDLHRSGDHCRRPADHAGPHINDRSGFFYDDNREDVIS